MERENGQSTMIKGLRVQERLSMPCWSPDMTRVRGLLPANVDQNSVVDMVDFASRATLLIDLLEDRLTSCTSGVKNL